METLAQIIGWLGNTLTRVANEIRSPKAIGVLFVCQGNMVRSQVAEALYKKYKNSNSFSAGIFPILEGYNGKKLKDIPHLQNLISLMKKDEGIDLSDNICKVVTKKIVERADKVIVMANKELRPGFLQNGKNLTFWEIENSDSKEVIDAIKEKVLTL